MKEKVAMKWVEHLAEEEHHTRIQFYGLIVSWALFLYSFQFSVLPLFGDFPLHNWLETIIHDLTIALIVSLTVFIVEARLRNLHLEQVQANVWQSTLKSMLPEELAEEITMLIKEPVFRENIRYGLTICPYKTKEGLIDENLVVIRRELRYTARNITDTKRDYSIKSIVEDRHSLLFSDDDPPQPVGELPILEIDDRKVQLVPWLRRPRSGFQNLVKDLKDRFLERRTERLIVDKEDRVISFSRNISIPPRGSAKIYYIGEEVLRLTERKNTYVLLRPGVNLFVNVANSFPEKVKHIDISLNHRRDFETDHVLSRRFEGGILPGQSFEVEWKLAEDIAPAPGTKVRRV